MSTIIQFQVKNYEDFKNEIINGVVNQIKDLGLTSKKGEENTNKLLSRDATAKMLNISTVTLWELARTNAIKRVKIGRKVLFKESDILEFINSRNNS